MKQPTVYLEPDWGIAFERRPEIEVRYAEERAETLYVLGIAHGDIRIGDRFRSVHRYAPPMSVVDTKAPPLARIELQVITITSFHNMLNRIPAGMTVGLELAGDARPVLDLLTTEDWIASNGQYHQWSERVQEMAKFTLAR